MFCVAHRGLKVSAMGGAGAMQGALEHRIEHDLPSPRRLTNLAVGAKHKPIAAFRGVESSNSQGFHVSGHSRAG